jgi:hypothetical protein
MIILEKDISEPGLDGLKLKCSIKGSPLSLSISRTIMSMLNMGIEDSLNLKLKAINNLLYNHLKTLDNDEILQEVDIDSEKIIFITNFGKKVFSTL